MDFISILHLTPLQVLVVWAVFAIVACAVNAMPEPVAGSSMFYRWLYVFSHTVGANLKNVLAVIRPGTKSPQA